MKKISVAEAAGRPWSCALMDQGSGGLLYFFKRVFVTMVYLSSESRRSPSMSKRQARIGGKSVRGAMIVIFCCGSDGVEVKSCGG